MAFGIGGPILETIFIILSVTFLSASLLAHWREGRWIDRYYTAAAYWFGLVNFLFMGVVVFFFTANAFYAADYYIPPALIAGVVLSFLFLLHCYGTWVSGRAGITRVKIALPNLPNAWRGKKIVFVSDFHLGNVRREEFAAKVVRKIQALAPEMVLVGGDLYDGVACDAAALVEPLRGLRPPKGVYFVTGNHEYFIPHRDEALAAIRGVGIKILNNEKTEIDGITFLGVDNNDVYRDENFRKVLSEIGVPRNMPTVLVKHEPSHLETARDAGVLLVLSGHTHHGQIFPLNFLTWQIYRGFDYGLKRRDGMQVYTSSGVGTWAPPLRLATKSEIVQMEFI